jgi:hypothetical protein
MRFSSIYDYTTKMPYSDTSISFNLINDEGNYRMDDNIRIRKNYMTNEFDISYNDQNDGSPVTHKVSGLSRSRVLEYVYLLFKNQYIDDAGYKSIQITLPAMPRIIVSGDKFKQVYYREHFMEVLEMGLDLLENTTNVKQSIPRVHRSNWIYETPVSNRSTAPGVRPQHLFFDE